jgi:hypothetical protein
LKEPRIQFYADLLVKRLQEHLELQGGSDRGVVVDVVDWFHWFAFDLVGELAFGEAFGCLDETKTHPWITRILSSIKG